MLLDSSAGLKRLEEQHQQDLTWCDSDPVSIEQLCNTVFTGRSTVIRVAIRSLLEWCEETAHSSTGFVQIGQLKCSLNLAKVELLQTRAMASKF